MSLAVVTVNAQSPALDHKSSEVALVARALELAAQSIRSGGGAVTSGNIVDTGANVIGSFVYTAQASS